ncbi:lysis protein [Pseudomonas yamanorum]|nr:lysis protein [Pseudomonas yamanorum]
MLMVLAMAGAAAMAWQLQAWRYGVQLERQSAFQTDALNQQLQTALHQQQLEQTKRLALEQQLSARDQQHAQELSDAQRDQARLRDRLATADLRLSVLLDITDPATGSSMLATPSASGVVHGASRARLDPAHAQRIIGITDAGDNGLIALRACQAYIRALIH